MAGSIAVTTSDLGSGVTEYSIAWTSDASGNVSANAFPMKMGTLVAVEFTPGSGGVQPTDLYDIDMLDAEGATMFDDGAGTSIGANLSNLVTVHRVPLVGLVGVTIYRRWHHGGDVQPTVANAGNAKSGTINVFVANGVL